MAHLLNLIMAQRLVRTIDVSEKEKDSPTKEQLSRLGISDSSAKKIDFFRGKKLNRTTILVTKVEQRYMKF